MRVLGAAPANDYVALVVVDVDAGGWELVDTSACRKIVLGDHEDSNALRTFREAVEAFTNSYEINEVQIRRCTYKGQKRSGAASIKIEVLLQMLDRPCRLIPAQSITKNFTDLGPKLPPTLTQYQKDAFATALYYPLSS